MTLIKKSDSQATIQKKLLKGGEIRFEKGTYNLVGTLTLESNSDIDLCGAVLKRYHSSHVFRGRVASDTIGYGGIHDVKIHGGTIEGINTKGYGASPLLSIMHAKEITITDMTFLDAVEEHAIDLVGCSDVLIERCDFRGIKLGEKVFKEAIQIDFAWARGCGIFDKSAKTYDLTHCKNIVILNCTFSKSQSREAYKVCIGTHTMAYSGVHDNISIVGCTAYGNGLNEDYSYFVRGMNFQNLKLQDNAVGGYRRALYIEEPKKRYLGDGTHKTKTARKIVEV